MPAGPARRIYFLVGTGVPSNLACTLIFLQTCLVTPCLSVRSWHTVLVSVACARVMVKIAVVTINNFFMSVPCQIAGIDAAGGPLGLAPNAGGAAPNAGGAVAADDAPNAGGAPNGAGVLG